MPPAAVSGATGRDSPGRWAPGAVTGEGASHAGGRKGRKDRKNRKDRKLRDRSRSRSGDQRKHGKGRREKRRRSPSSSPSGSNDRHSRKQERQDGAEKAVPEATRHVRTAAEAIHAAAGTADEGAPLGGTLAGSTTRRSGSA